MFVKSWGRDGPSPRPTLIVSSLVPIDTAVHTQPSTKARMNTASDRFMLCKQNVSSPIQKQPSNVYMCQVRRCRRDTEIHLAS